MMLKGELQERARNFGANHVSIAETLNALALASHHVINNQEVAIKFHCEAKHSIEGQL